MNYFTSAQMFLAVLWSFVAIRAVDAQDTFPGYKLQHWRFRDQVLSFPHSPTAVHALASTQEKIKAGKPRQGFASLTLPSSLVTTLVSPSPGKGADEVNRLVDKVSAASSPQHSHYPKIKPRKGGPPHYPPLNRKALYATGLIYLRDFRPGSALYK